MASISLKGVFSQVLSTFSISDTPLVFVARSIVNAHLTLALRCSIMKDVYCFSLDMAVNHTYMHHR